MSFATPRQHRRFFLGARLPMLAWASLQSLCPSPRHANTDAFSSARGCPYWRWPPRKAFVFRHATPTPTPFPRRAGAHVGVGHPAKPLSFVSPRQQGPDFLRRRPPMLALAFPESLCLSPRHANTGAFSSARGCPCWRRPPRKAFVFRHANRARIFCVGGRPCWRRAPRKALRLRLATPTGPEFSAPAVAHVGVGLPAKPLSFATPRQHRRLFLGARAPMLASATPQSLCPSSRHANRARIFCAGGRPCWRWPSRKAFVFRHATPTPALFPRRAAAHVGVGLPGKPLPFISPRQHRRLYPSPRHANRTRALPANRACPPRARFPCRPALYPVLYRIICCI